MKPATLRKVADAVFLAVFVFSVVVQINDPDRVVWMAIYALASITCVLALRDRGHWAFPAIVGVVALVWAARIAPKVVGTVPFVDMFGAFEMESLAVEESREMYGLLIVAGWMAVLSIRTARARVRGGALSPGT